MRSKSCHQAWRSGAPPPLPLQNMMSCMLRSVLLKSPINFRNLICKAQARNNHDWTYWTRACTLCQEYMRLLACNRSLVVLGFLTVVIHGQVLCSRNSSIASTTKHLNLTTHTTFTRQPILKIDDATFKSTNGIIIRGSATHLRLTTSRWPC